MKPWISLVFIVLMLTGPDQRSITGLCYLADSLGFTRLVLGKWIFYLHAPGGSATIALSSHPISGHQSLFGFLAFPI